MDENKKEPQGNELTRFQKLARALFGVARKDVEKHEPKKRIPRTERPENPAS